jgi:hypothetical protein
LKAGDTFFILEFGSIRVGKGRALAAALATLSCSKAIQLDEFRKYFELHQVT